MDILPYCSEQLTTMAEILLLQFMLWIFKTINELSRSEKRVHSSKVVLWYSCPVSSSMT